MRFNVAKRIGCVQSVSVNNHSLCISLFLFPLKESLILFISALVAVRFKTRLSTHLIRESDNKKKFPPVCELRGVEKKKGSYLQHADACNETLCVKKSPE